MEKYRIQYSYGDYKVFDKIGESVFKGSFSECESFIISQKGILIN